MAWILWTWIEDAGDEEIKVGHSFYGLDKPECLTYYREHISSCEYFDAAVRDGRVYGEWEEVAEKDLPDPEEFDDDEVLGADGNFAPVIEMEAGEDEP
jgi:hypothetical protein